jgi:hypothetical protein
MAIDPGQFALAAAEGSKFEAELIERQSGTIGHCSILRAAW